MSSAPFFFLVTVLLLLLSCIGQVPAQQQHQHFFLPGKFGVSAVRNTTLIRAAFKNFDIVNSGNNNVYDASCQSCLIIAHETYFIVYLTLLKGNNNNNGGGNSGGISNAVRSQQQQQQGQEAHAGPQGEVESKEHPPVLAIQVHTSGCLFANHDEGGTMAGRFLRVPYTTNPGVATSSEELATFVRNMTTTTTTTNSTDNSSTSAAEGSETSRERESGWGYVPFCILSAHHFELSWKLLRQFEDRLSRRFASAQELGSTNSTALFVVHSFNASSYVESNSSNVTPMEGDTVAAVTAAS